MNWQSDIEFRGEDFTATVTLGNPDVLVGSGMSSLRVTVQPITALTANPTTLLSICRYCCSTLPPVCNTSSGAGRRTGLPPQARRGRLGHVFSGEICGSV